MKHRQRNTFEDVLQATGTVWQEMPRGFKLEISEDSAKARPDRLIIQLPKGVTRDFRPGPRERFVARMSRGRLIVERKAPPRGKRPSGG